MSPPPAAPGTLSTAYAAWPGALALAGALLFMGVAAWRAWPSPEAAFLSDGSPVAWLSSAQLWALGLLTLQLGAQRALPPALAAWLAVALATLAFDEQFLFHEEWKYGCGRWLAACGARWVRELPTLVLAAGGLATVLALHRALPAPARRPLWLAFLTGLFALALDLGGRPVALLPYEEGLEVLAETGFAAALLGLRGRAPAWVGSAGDRRPGDAAALRLRCIRRRARHRAGATGRRG